MAGLERVLVGYREGDRQIKRLKDEHGLTAVMIKRCVAGCGYPVYFVPSGVDAYMTRDPEVICDVCYPLYKNQIMAEL